MSFPAIIHKATELGYALIALTDHVHVPTSTDYEYHLARLRRYQAWRNELPGPLQVVIGGEFEVARPGQIIFSAELVEACECVIVAPNHHQLPWIQPSPTDLPGAATHALDCIQTALDWAPTQAVAHPFFGAATCFTTDEIYAACDHGRLQEIMACALERDVAFEIQPKYWTQPTSSRLGDFFAEWLQQGGRVAMGSDAHKLDSLASWARQYHAIVERFALTRSDLWWPE